MATLTPTQAASIAAGVYSLREMSLAEMRQVQEPLGCEGLFRADERGTFQGRSGILCFKQLTNFGYIAEGEGPYQGEILVATRGTAIKPDWMTDGNIGMQRGPSGHLVHAGFNDTWKSFADDLRSFLRGRNPSTIHCVGHSLGGALAALNADYFSSIGAGQVKLYTFGSPRAGVFTFSRSLTRRIGADNIFRVSHASDPVPMVPLFPFQHLPHNREGLRASNSFGGLIDFSAHKMRVSYLAGVSGLGWSALVPADEPSDAKIQSWLAQTSLGSSGVAMGSAKLLDMIGRALTWVLARAKDVLIGAVGTALAVGATVLDQVAWLLSRAAAACESIAGHVKTLVGAIFRFLGRTVQKGLSLTAAFLRWCLDLLFTSLRAAALRALSVVS